jgi:hypothetical protein
VVERVALQLGKADVPTFLMTRFALYPVSQTEVTWKMPVSAVAIGVGTGVAVGAGVGVAVGEGVALGVAVGVGEGVALGVGAGVAPGRITVRGAWMPLTVRLEGLAGLVEAALN